MKLNQKELRILQAKAEKHILEAGKIIYDSWNSDYVISHKDIRDISTNVDIKIEGLLRKSLSKLLPEAGFIVEEGKTIKKTVYNWVIDPIDGTKQFVQQLPMFYSQIALLEYDKPIIGIVYNPISKQLFSASKNNGVFLNGIKFTANTKNSLSEAIIDIDFLGNDHIVEWKIKILNKIIKSCYRVRMFSGFLRPYIITGAIDAFIRFNIVGENKQTTDIAPHICISEEAGLENKVLEIDKKRSLMITANPALMKKIVSLISFVI